MSRQGSFVQRDAGPSDALHIGHRRIAVEVGAVIAVFLDHAEDARGCCIAAHARRHWTLCDANAVVVKRDTLTPDRNDDLQRPLRRSAEVLPQCFVDLGGPVPGPGSVGRSDRLLIIHYTEVLMAAIMSPVARFGT